MTVWSVVDTLTLLVLNDLLLIEERLLRHSAEHVAHAIGLEPETHLERVLRNDLEVDGLVERRPAVEGPTRLLDLLEELVLAHMLGFLEHDVLEQVREACSARLLPARADVVQDRNSSDRVGAVLVEDDLKAVVQGIGLIVDGKRSLWGA